ncbi:MAG TPA: serine/threonine-protein kinase [Pseudonocardiaceae bacterium]
MRDDEVGETAATPAPSGMADLSGSVVADRYRLAGPLGQGANANVYRAVDDRLDRKVAVKLFHPGQDTAVRARFGAEAQALARLSHPGLIGIYDAGVEGDRPYLVMQLVDGESLRERLLGGPLAADDVVLLGARLAMALAHVHSNGIVHRDIKPSNIVLDGNGSPHLADFGIALLLDAARVTGTNEIMGTAAYLSPEQILGVNVGAAADIYSLGLVLLECLTGELEYPGVSKVESALARLHRSPKIPDGIPPVLGQLLSAMTSRDPEHRPSAGDCAAWFWAAREHGGVSGRAARLAAASWLSSKGKQFGRSRTRAPLFSGWRRFAIAGSGLAMAVLASTWLFTSMLPRALPAATPSIGDTIQLPTAADTAPGVQLTKTKAAMHVAVAVTTNGRHAAVQQPGAPTTTGVPVPLTSTVTGPTPTGAPGTTTINELQDSSVPNDGPNSSTTPTDPPTTTDTINDGTNSSPPSDTTTDSSGAPNGGGPNGGGGGGTGNSPFSSVTPTPDPSSIGLIDDDGDH